MKINQFIKNAKYFYQSLPKVSVVMGNQSCDLDSIVSAIAMSYALSKDEEQRSIFIPIFNSTRSILKSKRECMLLLDYFSINLDEDLVFVSDWNAGKIECVFLVDHNELDEQQVRLGIEDKVCGIIDHHVDKKGFADVRPRIVDPSVGSNATLIVNEFLATQEIDQSLADMLLFPILSDTSNLTTRTSEKDRRAVEFLKKRMSFADLARFYTQLEEVKFLSDDNVDFLVLLQRDYKQYETGKIAGMKWGMSSVTFSLKKWLAKGGRPDLVRIESEFMKERGLGFFAMLSCFKRDDGEFQRDMILCGDEGLVGAFGDDHFKVIERVETDASRMAWVLGDVDEVKFTRKYWQPILEAYLNKVLIK